MGQAARIESGRQVGRRQEWLAGLRARAAVRPCADAVPRCLGCGEKEARYGFTPEDAESSEDRPRALCFSCFRAELNRRQAVAARLARGCNAEQVRLPLDDTLQALTRRRRRAQIAARHALGI